MTRDVSAAGAQVVQVGWKVAPVRAKRATRKVSAAAMEADQATWKAAVVQAEEATQKEEIPDPLAMMVHGEMAWLLQSLSSTMRRVVAVDRGKVSLLFAAADNDDAIAAAAAAAGGGGGGGGAPYWCFPVPAFADATEAHAASP